MINRIVEGSPAYVAGLSIRDEIIALDGRRVRPSDFKSRLADFAIGDTITLTVFRADQLRKFEVALKAQPVPSYQITKVETPSALQKSIYESWMKTTWEE